MIHRLLKWLWRSCDLSYLHKYNDKSMVVVCHGPKGVSFTVFVTSLTIDFVVQVFFFLAQQSSVDWQIAAFLKLFGSSIYHWMTISSISNFALLSYFRLCHTGFIHSSTMFFTTTIYYPTQFCLFTSFPPLNDSKDVFKVQKMARCLLHWIEFKLDPKQPFY